MHKMGKPQAGILLLYAKYVPTEMTSTYANGRVEMHFANREHKSGFARQNCEKWLPVVYRKIFDIEKWYAL
jgi:hypothetical protein